MRRREHAEHPGYEYDEYQKDLKALKATGGGYMDMESGRWVSKPAEKPLGASKPKKAPKTAPETLKALQEEQKALDAMTGDLLRGII